MARCFRNWNCHDRGAGFTLVEIIVTILIASILGVIAIQLSGTSLSLSADAIGRIQDGNELDNVMEQITRDYRVWLEDNEEKGGSLLDFLQVLLADDSPYISFIDQSATGVGPSFYVDPQDADIDLLQVTLTHESRTLVALFTR